jgi:phenylacetate-coenzyme A ligase PaaK-like adenylate-forming protein
VGRQNDREAKETNESTSSATTAGLPVPAIQTFHEQNQKEIARKRETSGGNKKKKFSLAYKSGFTKNSFRTNKKSKRPQQSKKLCDSSLPTLSIQPTRSSDD